jgi:hypothetical protein
VKENYFSFYERIAAITVSKLHEMYDEQLGEQVVNDIISSDPTYIGGDSIGSYTPWIFKQITNRIIDLDQLVVVTQALDLFNRYKPNLEVRDIYQYQSLDELLGVLDSYLPKQVPMEKGSEEILYDNGTWLLVSPFTFESECNWGSGTKWCTTDQHGKESGRRTFESIMQKSLLYIIINQQTGEKYQFDNHTGQFMNSLDRESYEQFINSDPPKELISFIEKNTPNVIQKFIENREKEAEFQRNLSNFFPIKEQLINHIQETVGTLDTRVLLKTIVSKFIEIVGKPILDYEQIREIIRSNVELYDLSKSYELISIINDDKELLTATSPEEIDLNFYVQGRIDYFIRRLTDDEFNFYDITNKIVNLAKNEARKEVRKKVKNPRQAAVTSLRQIIENYPSNSFTAHDIMGVILQDDELKEIFTTAYQHADPEVIKTQWSLYHFNDFLEKLINQTLYKEGLVTRKTNRNPTPGENWYTNAEELGYGPNVGHSSVVTYTKVPQEQRQSSYVGLYNNRNWWM